MKSMVTDDDKIDKLTLKLLTLKKRVVFRLLTMSGGYSTLCLGSQMST